MHSYCQEYVAHEGGHKWTNIPMAPFRNIYKLMQALLVFTVDLKTV